MKIDTNFSTQQFIDNQKTKKSNEDDIIQQISKEKETKHIEKKEIKEEKNDKLKNELKKVVEELNKVMSPLNQDLKFNFNDKIDNFVVQVVDTKEKKVIREFPPKEALHLMEKMRELVGILFNQKG